MCRSQMLYLHLIWLHPFHIGSIILCNVSHTYSVIMFYNHQAWLSCLSHLSEQISTHVHRKVDTSAHVHKHTSHKFKVREFTGTEALFAYTYTHPAGSAGATACHETGVLLRDQEVTLTTEITQTRCDICSSVVATASTGDLPAWSMQM